MFSNITENQNVPRHEVLGDGEKKKLLETYGIKESQVSFLICIAELLNLSCSDFAQESAINVNPFSFVSIIFL